MDVEMTAEAGFPPRVTRWRAWRVADSGMWASADEHGGDYEEFDTWREAFDWSHRWAVLDWDLQSLRALKAVMGYSDE